MKQKRYFCDWWDQNNKCLNKYLILFLIIGMEISYLFCNVPSFIYGYSEYKYQHLEEIAYNIIEEGCVKLEIMPEGFCYDITSDSEAVIMTLYSDDSLKWEYAQISIQVKVFNDNELEFVRNYSSRSEQITSNIVFFVIKMNVFTVIFGLLICLVAGIILTFLDEISRKRKMNSIQD